MKIIRRHGLKRFTDASIIDENYYLAELSRTREQGWGTDVGEYLSGLNWQKKDTP